MALKACKQCKRIHDHVKCPACGSDQSTDTFKGKVVIIKPDESEIAKNLKIKEKGTFAVKLG
ncbi:DNA-directed RNA polymerase subunit E'' [Candidatus Pacearchaeota archaeon]|nr:DNA-directed RNA polymerase subunit E'' [Candidatus Pacearchaeota archaeon]